MGRLFGIADIHGRLDLLNKLLDRLFTEFNLDLTVDKIVFTGDYVDRGPDSYGVIKRLMELQAQYPDNVICLAGNHEWINILYFTRKNMDDIWLFENNGGPETLESYRMAGFSTMTHDHLKWLAHLPFSYETGNYFFSHAPIPADHARNVLHRGTPINHDEMIWSYLKYPVEEKDSRNLGPGIVSFCGHIHRLREGVVGPRMYDHYIFGDAGCGCHDDAPLCAVEVKSREVIYAWPD